MTYFGSDEARERFRRACYGYSDDFHGFDSIEEWEEFVAMAADEKRIFLHGRSSGRKAVKQTSRFPRSTKLREEVESMVDETLDYMEGVLRD